MLMGLTLPLVDQWVGVRKHSNSLRPILVGGLEMAWPYPSLP